MGKFLELPIQQNAPLRMCTSRKGSFAIVPARTRRGLVRFVMIKYLYNVESEDYGMNNRIIVVGCPGSGKSVLSRRLSEKLNIPVYHMDNLYWDSNWNHITRDELREKIGKIMDTDRWIIDGNYISTLEDRVARCDTVIFLDYSVEECLTGIEQRMGKPRPDVPFIEENHDTKFQDFVKNFSSDTRPLELELFDRYKEKEILIFNSRKEAYESLDINEVEEVVVDLKDYDISAPVFNRTAVRGIVRRDGKYLLIYSKYGDHKFPGGGQDSGESLIDTLVREIKEETGYELDFDENITPKYVVYEKRKGEFKDIMEMTSHYYVCSVKNQPGERNLDDYEEEYDYQVKWMTLEEAIAKNELVDDYANIPWIARETMIMKKLISE